MAGLTWIWTQMGMGSSEKTQYFVSFSILNIYFRDHVDDFDDDNDGILDIHDEDDDGDGIFDLEVRANEGNNKLEYNNLTL